ncbi:MAG: TonB-dependent receptor [Acidobacteria bacterium]|nr:TonB-dependent receptor [Acidobacteriota bacterium]
MNVLGHRVTLALFAMLLATTTAISAQQAAVIGGRIADQTGAAVPGATVELVGTRIARRATIADDQGRYHFEDVPPGAYTLRVAASGFEPAERHVSAVSDAAATVDVRLGVSTLAESVVVTGARERTAIERQRALTPGGVTVVDGDELFRRSITGMADALRYVPGVWAESSAGGDEIFFSSRGSNLDSVDYDRNGIKMFQDGLPVTSADGNNHNRVVDPLSIRYAAIARGANALTYGASTLGGAIDFVSPTARNSSPVSVSLDSGSYGPFNGRATIGSTRGALDGLVTFEGRQFDGYREHSRQRRWGVYTNAGWQASDTVEVRVFGTYVNNRQHLPGALTRDESAVDPNQASGQALGGNYGKDLTTARVAARAMWTPAPNRSLMVGLSYEAQSLYHPIVDKVMIDFDGPGPTPPVEVFSLLIDTDHRDLGGVVRYNHKVGAHDLVMGVTYGRGSVEGGNYFNDGGRKNGINQYVDNRADSTEAYLMNRWHASSRWTVVAGAQVSTGARDVRTTDARNGDVNNPRRRYTAFSPRAGAIASLSPAVEVYGNVSRLYEAPTTFQMEDNVAGGGATLEPMSGTVGEIGLRSTASQASGPRWSWDVTAYYARIDDEILSVDDPGAPGNSLTTNIDRTVHAGIEALGSVSMPVGDRHRIDPLVSLTINRFRFDGDPIYGDNRLPAAPRYAARGEIIYRHAGGFYAGPTFDLVGQRTADFASTYGVDAYGLMGVRAGLSSRRWELFGEVRNVFDRHYVATLGVLNVAGADARVLYPGSPRAAHVGLRVSY